MESQLKKGRESLSLSLSSAIALVVILLMLAACSTRSAGLQAGDGGGAVRADGGRGGLPHQEGARTAAGGQGYGMGFGGGGGGANLDGGGNGPLGGGGVNAAPLIPQSLIDDGQPHSIGLWGRWNTASR